MKVIALNSGGFDSVVMINELLSFPEYEVISLFFNWGQPQYEQEKLCAEKIGARCSEHIEVKIDMPWVNTDMSEEAYIPMRNLVFSSYAISLAEQYQAKEIFMAILDNGYDVPYFDCSKDFYKTLNNLVKGKDIQIITPFINGGKYSLTYAIDLYNITRDDFFSCNTPIEGKPCNECGDCTILNSLYTPSVYQRTDLDTEDFKKAYMNNFVEEVRLLINNECQFTCKHCFYGCGEEKMPRFSTEEFKDVIRQCYDELKVNNLHFSGKEPMLDGTIFELTNYIDSNYDYKTYDIVTNGATISKFINQLKGCKKLRKLYLSVDTLKDSTTLRNTNKHIIDNIKLLNENNIPLQITIDVNRGNKDTIVDTIHSLVELEVKDIYIRNLKPNGSAIDIQDQILEAKEYGEVIDSITCLELPQDVSIEVYINKDLIQDKEGTSLAKYHKIGNSHYPFIGALTISNENYCYRYLNTITITPDGYVLGCAMDVSVPYYDELAGGNLHTDSIVDCLYKGRTKHLNKFICKSCKKGCTFNK